jgi:hypothetical protein
MAHDLERLKERISLLEYLHRHNWRPCRAGMRQEPWALGKSRPVGLG